MSPEELQKQIDDLKERFERFSKSDRYIFEKELEIANGRDFKFSTETGSKFGTGTDQKMSFYGVTPVDQPDTVSDVSLQSLVGSDTVHLANLITDMTNLQAAQSAIIDRLQELGLMA